MPHYRTIAPVCVSLGVCNIVRDSGIDAERALRTFRIAREIDWSGIPHPWAFLNFDIQPGVLFNHAVHIDRCWSHTHGGHYFGVRSLPVLVTAGCPPLVSYEALSPFEATARNFCDQMDGVVPSENDGEQDLPLISLKVDVPD